MNINYYTSSRNVKEIGNINGIYNDYKFTEEFYWDLIFEMIISVIFFHECGYLYLDINIQILKYNIIKGEHPFTLIIIIQTFHKV